MKDATISELKVVIDLLKEKKSKFQFKVNSISTEFDKHLSFIQNIREQENKLIHYKSRSELGIELYSLEDNFQTKTIYIIKNAKDKKNVKKIINKSLEVLDEKRKLNEIDLEESNKEIQSIDKKIEQLEKNISEFVTGTTGDKQTDTTQNLDLSSINPEFQEDVKKFNAKISYYENVKVKNIKSLICESISKTYDEKYKDRRNKYGKRVIKLSQYASFIYPQLIHHQDWNPEDFTDYLYQK